jgi:hypothetical protein
LEDVLKNIDLEPRDWQSDRRGPKPKYPRKTVFGLTDYGPPVMNWQFILTQIIIVSVIVLGTTL